MHPQVTTFSLKLAAMTNILDDGGGQEGDGLGHPARGKVRQRGSGAESPESRSRTVNAKLGSNSEPVRARVCQRVAVRATESQSGSQRARKRQ